MLRGKPKSLSWSPDAHEAFQHLKDAFSMAPILRHPDPLVPFVVEVDASTTGVGAVLSQFHGEPPRLHPCAYFSRKLTPAEQNYDIGNQELLAIKLALEEWHHWLEGASAPFTVITDHKNLQFLRDARRLNPRHARWAPFFTRFLFSSTYRPGSQDLKADALARLHAPYQPSEPEPILPPALILSPIQWELTKNIHDTTRTEPSPQGGPEGRTYVPSSQNFTLLGSVHKVPGSGHPGSQRTLSLLQARYWWPLWPRMSSGTSVAAHSVPCRRPPPIFRLASWFPCLFLNDIGVDLITDLPNSEGHTCVLVVVDRFSKAYRLIPLKGLSTALETAESLFHHVLRNYGLPENIVSDRGPQFMSCVWKAFYQLLGVTVSLFSGYHPQTNGQTERKIQVLGRHLRSYCSNDLHSWSCFLPWRRG